MTLTPRVGGDELLSEDLTITELCRPLSATYLPPRCAIEGYHVPTTWGSEKLKAPSPPPKLTPRRQMPRRGRQRRLTMDQVDAVKRLLAQGWSMRRIGAEVGLGKTQIYRIAHGYKPDVAARRNVMLGNQNARKAKMEGPR